MSEQEKRVIINTFEGGQVNDADLSKRQNNSFIYASNIRLIQDRNGFVITNIKGNKYSEADQVGFKITEGFIPLGGCEMDGILYVISCSTDWVSGEEDGHYGEIGCFPSWSSNDGNGTLEKVYRPLKNFEYGRQTSGTITTGSLYRIHSYQDGDSFTNVGASENKSGIYFTASGTTPSVWTEGTVLIEYGDFMTGKFYFDLDRLIECFAWKLIDGSVNIYFTDYKNPIRVVNNGFRTDGSFTEVKYRDNFFPNAISLILSGNKTLVVGTSAAEGDTFVQPGGNLRGGNYFFFFRYVNHQMNATHFVAETRPIQVGKGKLSVQFMEGSFDNSGKKVKFRLSNLDYAYKYVQVAYIRYYSDEKGEPLYETALVNFDYAIPDEPSDPDYDELFINVTGFEGERVITINDILENRLEDDVCRSMRPIETRLFGANWKTRDIHHDSMAEFASYITVTYNDEMKVPADPFIKEEVVYPGVMLDGEYVSNCGYKDFYRVKDNVGYFRGEAYPFAVRYELITGHISEAYPVTGCDEFLDRIVPKVKENTDGIYRFPKHNWSLFNSEYIDGDELKAVILRVSFNIQQALFKVLSSNDSDGLGWIKNNVRAIYFVRGDRYKTLEFQGLAMYCSSPKTEIEDDWLLTDMCTLYPKVSGVGDSTLNVFESSGLAYRQYDSEYGLYEQTWGRFTKVDVRKVLAGPTYMTSFFGAENGISDLLRSNLEENVHRAFYFPFYRGYAPMIFKDKKSQRDPDEDEKKATVKNYCSRWFMNRYYLAVFSPDFMFNTLNDVSPIKEMESIRKTIKATYTINDTEGNWEHDNLEVDPVSGELLWSAVYPRWTKADYTGMPFIAGLSNATSAFTVHSVGDEMLHLPQNNNNGFVNKTKDFWQSDVEALYFATEGKENFVWSNRNTEAPKYIGIKLNELPANGNYNLDIVNLYNVENRADLDILTMFNTSYTRYSNISDAVLLDWATIDPQSEVIDYSKMICGGGDCFLQRTYFKINGWHGTSIYDDGWENIDPEGETVVDFPRKDARTRNVERVKFTHGVVVGILTENAINTAMRSDKEGQSYYPKIGYSDLAQRCYSDQRKESFLINKGYNQILSPRLTFGYDPKYVIPGKIRTNRIRYSQENDSTSLVDGFRSWRHDAKIDYTTADGQIMRLMEIGGYLISICEKAINMHFVNEKQMQQDSESSSFVFGRGDIISDKVRRLAEYGSQHQWSIVKGENIYGIDFIRRKIWAVVGKNDYGYTSLSATDLSSSLMISADVRDFFNEWEANSTREFIFSDNPLLEEGIVGVYDPKHEEILFVFVRRTNVEISSYDDWKPQPVEE